MLNEVILIVNGVPQTRTLHRRGQTVLRPVSAARQTQCRLLRIETNVCVMPATLDPTAERARLAWRASTRQALALKRAQTVSPASTPQAPAQSVMRALSVPPTPTLRPAVPVKPSASATRATPEAHARLARRASTRQALALTRAQTVQPANTRLQSVQYTRQLARRACLTLRLPLAHLHLIVVCAMQATLVATCSWNAQEFANVVHQRQHIQAPSATGLEITN